MLVSLYAIHLSTSHHLNYQSIHYLHFIPKSLAHRLELFSRMSFEMAQSRVWDVLTPLCWVPPPTGTVWSSLLFRLHPAKHSAALHFIQKPMYSQKEIMSKYFLCNCFIQSKFKNLTYFPLKMGF